ncbi:hypothetical protein Kpol_339p9 [Vanderwaltozyma polyspora DSM 70294]|uniref:Methyltransferase OMS1, mitochondrial n=1 Tax=Vanderwaltozyma polyspora (strain ATCC 22028 / DSM 70294 / BCRC 21397 / CBS 2163 / NBRC 10782 / NRRL Y-8283 / UCD 57-17) TaxID=436907 RepID=A7TSD7_VANPO|nr:uncharacterized protein Kpol_339p9 [Vanderwaltozyma polyspora DSM 70294]EDO14822.1 hypothetical protein Kpol_339p9 [Vanderwaltozyma polyspora DSM 70294]
MMIRNLVVKCHRLGPVTFKVGFNFVRFSSNSHTYISKPNTRVRKVKTKEEIANELFERQLKSDNRLIRWGAIARSDKFRKGMTKYLIGLYVIFLIYGGSFMKELYGKEKELETIQAKETTGNINEYEQLRMKSMTGKLRTRDKLKLEKYEEMKKEGKDNFDGVELDGEEYEINNKNKHILPARDTTEFYEGKAVDYDKEVNFEERMIFMGRRRKWLMRHCKGDVLEVSCGTGRNIKYLDPSQVHSITYIDSSKNMIELSQEKFKERFPKFANAAFVVGKAEDLLNLASRNDEESKTVKYDTIVESFGLCSHEDPVKALKNFAKLLKPGGRIVLLEHGRGEYDFINKALDDRAEKRLETWGCRWNLDIGELLDDSGLDIVDESRTHLGTTWCIVAKKKGDSKSKEEIGFYEKYVSSGVQSKLETASNSSKHQQTK